ncbi:hypothetical protein JHK87_044895 [Glycine soja]|nr:hypothetical protein JHK87_044895 [Glycine soja]
MVSRDLGVEGAQEEEHRRDRPKRKRYNDLVKDNLTWNMSSVERQRHRNPIKGL